MHSNIVRALVVAAAALAVMGGIAFATGRRPGSSRDGRITACVRPNGQLRIAGSATGCRKDETVLRWGFSGPAGQPGRVGPTGRTGPRGPSGAKGELGTPGPAGPGGRNGGPGPAGQTGPEGPTGPAGAPGKPGSAGAPGALGSPGPAGARGSAGAAGATGPHGVAGAPGPIGPAGPRGADGLAGPVGAKGDPGPALTSFGELEGLACSSSGTIAISFDSAGRATLTCVTAPTGDATAAVRVNEVQTGTAAAAADEFVELANTGATAADVGGWKLVYRSATGSSDVTLATFPAGTTIAAGAFYLLGGSAFTGPPGADQSFGTGLAAAGGAVGLRDSAGGLVDGVGWGTAANALVEAAAAPAPPATTPGSSIVRLPDGHDTGSNAADFTVSATSTPRGSNS